MAEVSKPLPNYKGCFVCGPDNPSGLHLHFNLEDKSVSAKFRFDPTKAGFMEIVHGGVISSVLDEVMGWAPAHAKKHMCRTAELVVRFVNPLPVGVEVEARGRFSRDRRRVWETEGEIVGLDGTIYARGFGKYMPIPAGEMPEIDSNFVYPQGAVRIQWGKP